jgi:hypothetical protein
MTHVHGSIFMFLSIGLASGICPKSRCNSSLLARLVDVVVFALRADHWQTVARNLHTTVVDKELDESQRVVLFLLGLIVEMADSSGSASAQNELPWHNTAASR